MKKHLWWIILLGLVVSGVGGYFGVRAWRAHVRVLADERSYKRAAQAIKEQRSAEALRLFQSADHTGSPHPWGSIEVSALTQMGQVARLVTIYEKTPERILENEDAALLVARVYLHLRQKDKLKEISKGRKTESPAWGMLAVDVLMLDGKAADARKLLNSLKYQGTNDVQRLVRMALLSDLRAPTNAWNLLAEAAAIDPRNPDVRSFRAQLLEQLGKTALARVEYVAALVASPDPLRRDQLGEFYRRQGSLDLAIKTWRDGLGTNSIDFLWLKTAFWSRMVAPAPEGSMGGKIPPGALHGLATELVALPPGRFWSESLTNEVAAHRDVAAGRQELFWLELAELLRTRQEAAARDRLHFAKPGSLTWAPELARALSQILAWRQATNKTLNPPSLPIATLTTNTHSFFVALEELSQAERAGRRPKVLPPQVEAVLSGDYAMGAAFLANGWREAALLLTDTSKLPPGAPEWVTYAFAQALRYNRDANAALAFLETRSTTPLLELVRSEIQLGAGKTNESFAGLRKLAGERGDVGFRSAWLLATASLEMKDTASARKYIEGQEQLKSGVTGKELLARAALLDGKQSEAQAAYENIAKNSVEARAYLARQAFSRKEWANARRYTEELLAIMPDQMELRANLDAIAVAERGQP